MFPPERPTKDFPYIVEAQIGQGSMGTVFRAREPSLGRAVAIKVLRADVLAVMDADFAREATQRFAQEARAAAALSHPSITTIYRVGSSDGTPYIAMEWLEGETLEQVMKAGALSVEDAIGLVISLLDGLEAAHGTGIIHRDLKPANIMLLSNGRLKITDFGVAHVDQSDLVSTKANTILGTPLYASPEQLNGDRIDTRSDLYSAGVLLYELLTERLPFEAKGLFELARQVLTQAPPAPSKFVGLPRGLEDVVLKSLARDRSKRYLSASQMRHALMNFVSAPSLTGRLSHPTPQGGLVLTEPAGGPHAAFENILVDAREPSHMIAALAKTWESQPFGTQTPHELLARLLERPLHASAFAGVVRFDTTYILLHDGLIYGVFDVTSGKEGDAAHEALPKSAKAVIYPVPDQLDAHVIIALASLLHRPKRRHSELDTSYVDLGKMADALEREGFSGAIKLERERELGYILFWHGEQVLSLFSSGWSGDISNKSWRQWIDSTGARAHVEEHRTRLPGVAYREELRDFGFDIQIVHDDTQATLTADSGPKLKLVPKRRLGGSERAARGSKTLHNIYRSDPTFKYLCWMLAHLPGIFARHKRSRGWKYLAGWVKEIQSATLHHKLPRPQARQEDHFDLVTQDLDGKVLHVIDRRAIIDANALDEFVEKVKEAKLSRLKTGDIGGAILIARQFTRDVDASYLEAIKEPEKTSLFYNLQNSFNRYEGFVRIGPTRGFHLLLVRETDQGFEPLLPPEP